MTLRFEPVSGATAEAARAVILAGLTERFGVLRPEFLTDVQGLPGSYAPPALLLVGLHEGEVWSTAALTPGGPEVWRVRRMSVRADARRRGLARTTLTVLEAAARERGARSLVLETTANWESARRFYESQGFAFQGLEEQRFPDGGGNTVAHSSKVLK